MEYKIKVKLLDKSNKPTNEQCEVYDKIMLNGTDYYLYRNPINGEVEYIECYKIIDINKYINKKD